jgi:hypothetical protein
MPVILWHPGHYLHMRVAYATFFLAIPSQGAMMATQLQELAALERLRDDFGFTYDDLAAALVTNASTLHRWRSGTEPTPIYLQRLAAFASFLEELDALFVPDAQRPWIDAPRDVFKGATPREMILAGNVDRVTGVLYAMNAGAPL